MIHILNFESRIIDFFSNNDSNITIAEHTHNIEEDLETLVLTVGINRSENFRQRNRVLIEASDGRYREFIIQDTEDDLIEGETQVTCVASYLEDISKAKPMPPQKYDNMTLDEMLFDVLRATGWEVGYVDYMGIKDRSWTAYATPYEVLVMLKTTFKHEYEFLIEIEGNRVKRRIVNCIEPTNLFNGREIEYGKDLIGMTRTIDNSEVVTAYIGLGPEDDKGNRQVVEVVDNDAQEDLGLPENYLWGIYEPESENDSMTKERLTTLTRTALNKAKVASVSYEVEAVDIHKQFPHELIQIGDKVRIKNRDMQPALYADARVLEIVTDLINDTQTYKFGQVKEYNENTLRSYFNSLRAEFTKKLNDNINNLDTIISETVEGLDIYERKIFKGDTPPENPVNDALWYDTSNPDVAILRRYWNGEWITATAEDVEQLGGMTREQILYNELTNTFSNLAIQHSKLLNDVYAIINNEYLVDNDIKSNVQAKLDDTITVYQQISANLDSMTEETATIGKLMDTQALFLTYRQKLQALYITVENAQIAINERFKLLQSQYTQEKFNEAMHKVATSINGTFDEATGQLIADIPNQQELDDMRTTLEQSMNDMSADNAKKLQALQDGITTTNQRITSTEEELSAGITSVTQKVDGLQVGGRNLLLNSANINKAIDYTQGSYNQYFSIQITPLHEHFKKGDFITISFDVQMERGDYLKIYDDNQHWEYRFGNKIFENIGTEKQRLTATFELIDPVKELSTWQLAFYNDNNGDRFTIEKIKIEKGNVATAWTPAPEDTDEQLSDIKTSVQTQSADIKVLKEGINLKADNTEVTKIYDNYLTPMQTQINAQKATLDVLPSQIAAKVSQSTYNTDMNNVVTRLNSADSERTQLSNEIKDRVTLTEYNDMRIGTRNLVANSDFKDGMLNWRNVGSSSPTNYIDNTQTDLPNNFKNVAIVEATNVANYEKGIAQNYLAVEVGKEYVLSAWIKILSGGTKVRLQEGNGRWTNNTFDASTEWQRYEYKFTPVDPLIHIYLVTPKGTANNKFAVTGFQVVEGNKNTDWKPSDKDTDQRLTTMQTSIEQNGQEIVQRATKEEFNASKQTLSRVLAEIVTNTTTGISLTYDENGGIQNFTLGPNGTLIDTKKLTIEAGDVSLKNGVFTVNKINTKNVTIPRDDGGVPTIINGIDKQITAVTGMEPAFMSTFGVGNNIFITEIFRSGTWYGVFKRFSSTSAQDYARVNAYYFQHTRRYLRFNYLVHVGYDSDDRGNTPTGIYMKVTEFGKDVGNRMDYLNLVPTSQGGSSGIVEVNHVFDLGPPTGEPRAFYIHVRPNGEGIVGGSEGTDPRTWSKYSVCKFAFRPFQLYG